MCSIGEFVRGTIARRWRGTVSSFMRIADIPLNTPIILWNSLFRFLGNGLLDGATMAFRHRVADNQLKAREVG
jgi:hypothetical protein